MPNCRSLERVVSFSLKLHQTREKPRNGGERSELKGTSDGDHRPSRAGPRVRIRLPPAVRMAARRVLAARDISAERRCATALDRTHHLQLVEAHMPAVGVTPSRTVIAENVRDLQSWSSHGRGALLDVSPRTLAVRHAQAIER